MNKTFSIIGLIFLVIYLSIAASVIIDSSWVESFDLSVIGAIQSHVTSSGASAIAGGTDIGGTESVVVLTLAVVMTLFIKKMYFAGFWFGMTVLISPGILVSLMKRFVNRDRPEFLRLAAETSQSFPSGHSTASTVFFGLSGVILIFLVHQLWKKYIIAFLVCAIILFVMTSRIYLGVHFPTDVLAGFTFGTASILLSISLYHLIRPIFLQWLSNRNINDKSPALYH